MDTIVTLHSLWRWIVLLLALAAVIKSLVGWLGRQSWSGLDNRLGLFYTISFDIQMVIGLVLYIGVITGSHLARWYSGSIGRVTGEHVVLMVIALALAHIARSRAKKESAAVAKHRIAAIGFGLSLIIMIVAIPTWNFGV